MQNKLQKILTFGFVALAIGLFQVKPAEANLLRYYQNVAPYPDVGGYVTLSTTTDWSGIPAKYAINYSSSTTTGSYLAGKPTGNDCLRLRSYNSGQLSATSTRVIEPDGRYTDYYLAGDAYYANPVTLGQYWGEQLGIAVMIDCGAGTGEGANFSSEDLDLYIFDNPTDTIQSVSPPAPPSLEFAYPTDGMSTPLFSDYLLTTGGLIGSHAYVVRYQSYVTETSTSTTKIAGARGVTDWYGIDYGLGNDLMTYGIEMKSEDYGVNFAFDYYVHVSAQLYSSQHPTIPNATLANPILVTSSTITYRLEAIPTNAGQYITPILIASSTAPSGFYVSTSTRPVGAVQSPTLRDATDCSIYPFTDTYSALGINIPFLAPTAMDRIICNAKSGINNFIADLGDFGTGQLSDLTNKIKTVFPINIFSHVNDNIEAARNASTSFTGDIVLAGEGLFVGRSMTILSSDKIEDVLDDVGAGEGGHFPIKDFIDKVLYLITGVTIITLTIREIKSLRNA